MNDKTLKRIQEEVASAPALSPETLEALRRLLPAPTQGKGAQR